MQIPNISNLIRVLQIYTVSNALIVWFTESTNDSKLVKATQSWCSSQNVPERKMGKVGRVKKGQQCTRR